MNIIEAIRAAEKGAYIWNGFMKKQGYVLEYQKEGTFLKHRIIDGKLAFGGSIDKFTVSEIITKSWEIYEP